MINVFVDYHHEDLFHSLQLLFEKRLGWNLYSPIGMEWYHQGYWNVYPHPATAQQFLSLNCVIQMPTDVHGFELPKTSRFNENYVYGEDGIYYILDQGRGKIRRAITLDKFKDMKFDIIISSMPGHIPLFNKLISLYQPTAKHIFQEGNNWGCLSGIKNILSSTAPFTTPSDVNVCFYSQEFNLDLFSYVPPVNRKQVNSYIHFMREPEVHILYKKSLPEFSFTTYGAGMDTHFGPIEDGATAYKNSGWTWHVKPEGDGYGYSVIRSGACGRPLIVKANYYVGKKAAPLMEDLHTCIDISRRSVQENISLIRKYSEPEEHNRLCDNMYRRFTEVINFDNEFEKIKVFLSNLR